MNLDPPRARALVQGLAAAKALFEGVQVGVFPPFTLIHDAVAAAAGAPLAVGAQNCHHEPSGAYTGEVSAAQVRATGATHVLVGHSERRRDYGEAEPLLQQKLRAALAAGLAPVLCVGERLEERDTGRTLDVVGRQLDGALAGFTAAELAALVVAYEPVWAIGTGRNATPAQAVEVHRFVRGRLAERFAPGFAGAARILYGGSVTKDNASALLAEDEIDGALVGGASLALDSFLSIARAARA